ncbi:MAG TPA: polysaccharide deacetylase family protein [Chloroflexia bacterium]|nr:polysaccharide deacetylase family protein [Chloroflexia bacterium]
MTANKSTVPVLMYHSISSESSPKFKRFTVSKAHFENQIHFLQEQGYRALTVTQYTAALRQDPSRLPAKPLLITFDDGFADFYFKALPVLQKYNFNATLYVSTAYVGGTSTWLYPEGEGQRQMLGWEQLEEIVRAGIECGGHSHRHLQLDILPAQVVRDEVKTCKDLLESRLGQEISSFAYPYGYFNRTVKQIVKTAGYSSACAVRYSLNSAQADPFELNRLIVTSDTGITELEMLLRGASFSAVPVLKRVLTPGWRVARHLQSDVNNLRGKGIAQYGAFNR